MYLWASVLSHGHPQKESQGTSCPLSALHLCDRGKGSPEIGCFKTNNTQLLVYAKGETSARPWRLLASGEVWVKARIDPEMGGLAGRQHHWDLVGEPGLTDIIMGAVFWTSASHSLGAFTEGSLTLGICNPPARTLSLRHRTPSFFVHRRSILYCTSFFWILSTSPISWSHLKFQSHIFPHAKSDFWISLNMKLNHY